jgi:hypothetical protein
MITIFKAALLPNMLAIVVTLSMKKAGILSPAKG